MFTMNKGLPAGTDRPNARTFHGDSHMSTLSIHELFYESEPGILRWKIGKGTKVKAGDIAGSLNICSGRWQIKTDKQLVYRYRIIWEMHYGSIPGNMQIDHINRNKLDDKITNLRLSSAKENSRNREKQSNSSSKLKGVSWHKVIKKWRSCIKSDHKFIHIGYFETKYLAYAAYCDAALELHGEFACV